MNVTIGARVVKTGIAVALAIFFAHLLVGPMSGTIAGVAAIFAIQPSVYRSWQHLLEQVQTNTLGAVLALAVGMIVPVNEVVVGLTCIAVILITIALKMESAVVLTLVTTIIILETGGEWAYALERFLTILVGIGAAFIVNATVMPPNHQEQFLNGYRNALSVLSLLLRTSISDELKESEVKAQRDKLNNIVRKLGEQYGMLEEEWRKWKRFRPHPGRHLVVQKQMVRAMVDGQIVLDAVGAYYFPQRKDDSKDRTFDELLEELIHYHEYTLLKYEGKMKPGDLFYDQIGQQTEGLLKSMIQAVKEDDSEGVSLVVLASSIYEYGRQLRRLDKMIGNIQ